MLKKSTKLNTILLLLIFLFGTNCSTKKNTAISRAYHNLTSKYNIYFNGYESYKKGIKKINDALEDDFTHILPIFPYENKSAAESAKSDMDRSIKNKALFNSMASFTRFVILSFIQFMV